MNTEQQAQAKNLFFQTDLSKTQIAEVLDIPRRTLHYWIKEKNWERLKLSAAHMPSLLAENCYHLIARFTEQLLSEDRIMKPITHQEADTLHKLTLTVNKLKNRSTLNESMEMLGLFMDSVNKKSPELATAITPLVDDYINSRAGIYPSQFRPDNFNGQGLITKQQEDIKEIQLDIQDIMDWTENDPIEQSPSPLERAGVRLSPSPQPVPSDSRTGEEVCPGHLSKEGGASSLPSGEGRGGASLEEFRNTWFEDDYIRVPLSNQPPSAGVVVA